MKTPFFGLEATSEFKLHLTKWMVNVDPEYYQFAVAVLGIKLVRVLPQTANWNS